MSEKIEVGCKVKVLKEIGYTTGKIGEIGTVVKVIENKNLKFPFKVKFGDGFVKGFSYDELERILTC